LESIVISALIKASVTLWRQKAAAAAGSSGSATRRFAARQQRRQWTATARVATDGNNGNSGGQHGKTMQCIQNRDLKTNATVQIGQTDSHLQKILKKNSNKTRHGT
jgi:hypothetical protein